MSENEKMQDSELELDLQLEPEQLQEEPDFDLDDIMKEFSGEEDGEPLPADDQEEPEEPMGDTVRIELPPRQEPVNDLGDTVRFELPEEPTQVPEAEPAQEKELPKKEEPFSENWQPEFEQPMGEYVPPQPIIFHPRARLRELKRKLVAGPERRYYEINEIGFGKLQAAIFISLLVVVLAVGTTVLYAMGMVQPQRLKLMVFCQFFAILMSALLGSFQMIEGLADLVKGRFSLNTMLIFTFLACCADGVLCLQEERIPCCAVFSLQVTMSLWGAYHRRSTEMAMMDTLRKAVHLDGIKIAEDYYSGANGLLRSEGQVEDFMDNYRKSSGPEKVLNWYALAATLLSIGSGVAAWLLYGSVSFGVQVMAVSMLAAVPVTSFITLSRPMAILERRLRKLGTVLCGWKGVLGLNRKAVFPLTHEDLFPVGSCKLNGVKFYGERNTDQVVAYCAALVSANGGGLVPLFDYLLTSRNGRHYSVQNLRGYDGGIGGEVCGEPVLMGTLKCLKDMGVEIPEGTSVNQAVYAAIDGELCGVFAVTYAKAKSSVAGLRTMCTYPSLRPVLVTEDFMLTEGFIRSRFGVNTRRMAFPPLDVRGELAAVEAKPDAPAMALITSKGLAPYAFAVTGARSLRTASIIGVIVHMLGGILGLGMMVLLTVLDARELLTPMNVLLYELVWMIPGLLLTEWTRAI